MNSLALIFLLVASVALWVLPRRWAPVPLLAGACYITMGQQINLGPFSFTVLRLLILVGVLRVFLRGERLAGGVNGLDWFMIAWSVWATFVGIFHEDAAAAVVFRLGVVYNTLGFYLLVRCFCQTREDVFALLPTLVLLLTPIALSMIYEQLTNHNLFGIFGGLPEEVVTRGGRLRAQGPFRHPILAGTVGAVCVPLMIGLWGRQPMMAKLGLGACLAIAITSASSGPLLSIMVGVFALVLWRWRQFTPHLRVAAVVGYILLDIVMKDPAYFILRRIDLTGSSSSYHRPAIIRAAIEHLDEWWFAGTDHTRHWMPYGVSWSEDHSDITNHYIAQGVRGGLLQMFLFIGVLWCGFRYVGIVLHRQPEESASSGFAVWSLGACLFAHAATCVSVAYFDQSVVFLYLPLAMVGSLQASMLDQTDTRLIADDEDVPDSTAPTAGTEGVTPSVGR